MTLAASVVSPPSIIDDYLLILAAGGCGGFIGNLEREILFKPKKLLAGFVRFELIIDIGLEL